MQAGVGIAVNVFLEGELKPYQGFCETTYSISTSHLEYYECPVCKNSKVTPHKQFYYRGQVRISDGDKSFHKRVTDAVVADVSLNSPFTILRILDAPEPAIVLMITPMRFITSI
jgi:hypothetical protein